MIYRLYGTSYQSVDLNFDAHALNEVGFRRNRKNDFPAEELTVRYRPVDEHDLTAEASGAVQGETEQLFATLLDRRLHVAVQKWIAPSCLKCHMLVPRLSRRCSFSGL